MKVFVLGLALMFLSACSVSHVMKNCVQATDGKYICQNLKPWE